jgi:hypothetical protein
MTEPVIETSFAEVEPDAPTDATIWVEVLSRHGDVLARHRCAGPELSIGRGYGNDVLIDDPYVAPAHLRIRRDVDGSLVAEDLGTVNGSFVDRAKEPFDRVVLDGEQRLRIGHTYLRIRDAAHPVVPERTVQPQRRLLPIAAGLGALIIGIEVLTVWLNETAEPKLQRYLLTPLVVALVLLVWTAIWSVLSRIFAGQARLERNLLIALGGALAYSLWNEIVWLYSFAFASRALVASGGVAFWLILAVICFLHLRSIGSARPLVKAGAVLLLAGAGLGTQALTASDTPGSSPYQAHPRRLLPPAFRIAAPVERDDFAAELTKLKPLLDKERAAEPAQEPTAEDDDG